MGKVWWHAAWGLCLLQLSLAQTQTQPRAQQAQTIDLNITCRYAGVFHVEKNGRYSISRTEAADLCQAFNSTLPTMAQMELALEQGFETCRYGFIEGHVVIPRITPNAICAANNTGVYILTSNTSQYDTYCFNASAPLKEDCTSVTDLPNSFEGQVTITIVNRDGTRYSKKGEYRTHPEDLDPKNNMDEDVSSGSSSEKSTSGSYVFHTHLPTTHPTQEDDGTWISYSTPVTIASTVHTNSHAATQEQNNWMWFWFGNSQPKTQEPTTTATTGTDNQHFNNTIMVTTALMTTPETAPKRQEAQDWLSWLFQPSESKSHLHTTAKMPGTESNTISAGWEPQEGNEDGTEKYLSFSGSGIDDDEDFIASTISSTPWVSDHTKQNEDWTQWRPSPSNPEERLQSTTKITDVDRNSTIAQGENRTLEPQPPLIHHERQDEEEILQATRSTWATHTSTTEETATQKDQWFGNGWHGNYAQTPSEDSHATAGTTDTDSSHSATLQPTPDPNTHLVEALDRTGPLSVTTQQSDSQSFSTLHGEPEEEKDHLTTPTPPSSTRTGGKDGRRGGGLPENSTTSLEGYTPRYPDIKENRTFIPVTPVETGTFGETEVTIAADSNFNVDGSLPGDRVTSRDPRRGSHTVTHGSESAGHSSGSQEGGVNTTSSPMRKPQIPEWLIILASLLALVLILAVCIAVNSRRRCGQKKKLVINSGNGTVEDRKPSELNGEASKSQEMVHLVNKEPSETPDQFMTADETRNLQNVDMKIGV